MSNARKRRAQVDDNDYDVAAVPQIAAAHKSRLEKELENYSKKLLRISAQMAEKSDSDARQVSVLPRCELGPLWSDQDEENVQNDWKAHSQEWKLPQSIRQEYRGLWKMCLHIAACTPWDIIGVKTRLQFELDAKADPDPSSQNMWSAKFCKALKVLVAHPIWSSGPKSRAANLAVALQYAVILRTNDQRAWDISHFKDECFEMLHEQCVKKGPRPMPQHRQVVTMACARAELTPTPLWTVLDALESIIVPPEAPAAVSASDPYKVVTQDLTRLKAALESLVDPITGFPIYGDPDIAFQMAARQCFSRKPNAEAELDRFHELAMIEESRRRRLRERKRDHVGGIVAISVASSSPRSPVSGASVLPMELDIADELGSGPRQTGTATRVEEVAEADNSHSPEDPESPACTSHGVVARRQRVIPVYAGHIDSHASGDQAAPAGSPDVA